MKSTVKEYRELDENKLVETAKKKRLELVGEISVLANQGRKNSKTTKQLKKEIARIETVLSEKIIKAFEENNG